MKSLEERSCDLGVLSARNMTACDLIEPAFNAGECQSNTIKVSLHIVQSKYKLF